MKTFLLFVLLLATMLTYAQRSSLTNTTCANPVNPHAENIKTNSALLVWKNRAAKVVSFNIIWRRYGAVKWDTVYNIPDTAYLLTNLKTNTQYEFKPAAVCGDSVSRYRVRNVFSTLAKGGYCAAHSNSLTYIQLVRTKYKTNNTGSDNNGYGDYTNVVFQLAPDNTKLIYVKPFKTNIINDSVTTSVYIDFNKNKILNDPGELVGRISSLGGKELAFKFKVPAGAVNGITRMRVVVEETFFRYDEPCNFTNGEAEDYGVNITAASENITGQSIQTADDAGGKSFVMVNPNPVQNNNAIIKYSIAQNGNVQLMVIDYAGKAIKIIGQGMQSKGYYTKQLNTGNINAGNYMLVLIQDNIVMARTGITISR